MTTQPETIEDYIDLIRDHAIQLERLGEQLTNDVPILQHDAGRWAYGLAGECREYLQTYDGNGCLVGAERLLMKNAERLIGVRAVQP